MPQELHRVSCDASGAAFANGAEMRPTKAIFVRKPGSLLRVAPSRRPSSTSSSWTAVIPALTAAAETLFFPMPSASHTIGPTQSYLSNANGRDGRGLDSLGSGGIDLR